MKALYLLRHAHAVPSDLSLSDFDRPLDDRGRNQAGDVATYLRKKNIVFDFAMCSAALRTQETIEPLRELVNNNAIEVSIDFYNISEEQIFKHLRHISDDQNTILYVGHNPGIAFAALKLAKVFPKPLMEGVTPATLIGFHISIDKWKDLEWGIGEIIDVFQPESAAAAPLSS